MVRNRNGSRHPAIHIGVLKYADDICLLAESIDDVECSLYQLENSAAENGLTINHNKSKMMNLAQASFRYVRFVNADPVGSCDKFKYLGVPTSNAKRFFDLVSSRHGQSRQNSTQSSTRKRMTPSKLVSADQQHKLCRLECLPLTLTLHDKLDAAYRCILNYALGVHFPHQIYSTELMRRTGQTALSKTLPKKDSNLLDTPSEWLAHRP